MIAVWRQNISPMWDLNNQFPIKRLVIYLKSHKDSLTISVLFFIILKLKSLFAVWKLRMTSNGFEPLKYVFVFVFVLSSIFFPPPRKDHASFGIEPKPFLLKVKKIFFWLLCEDKILLLLITTLRIGIEPMTSRLTVARSNQLS